MILPHPVVQVASRTVGHHHIDDPLVLHILFACLKQGENMGMVQRRNDLHLTLKETVGLLLCLQVRVECPLGLHHLDGHFSGE